MAYLQGPHEEVKADFRIEPGAHTFIRVCGVLCGSWLRVDWSSQTKKVGFW